MPEGSYTDKQTNDDSLQQGGVRFDFGVIAGASVLMVIAAFALQIPEQYSTAQLLPYVLLWGAVCFGFFMFRRWRLEKILQSSEGNKPQAEATPLQKGLRTWQWDIATDALVWSDGVYEVFGVSKDDYIPSYSDFLKFVHPEDRLYVEETVARTLRENVDFSAEHRIVRADGKVRIIHAQAKAQFKDGHPVKMTGNVTDVTETKQAEADLRDQFGMLQSLIDAIPIPVYHKDANGRYEGCNKAFESFAGATKEELLGKTIHDFWPADFADFQDNKDKALLRQGGVQTYECLIPSQEEHPPNVLYHKATLVKSDGSFAGLIGTILDISERKRMEVALKESEQRFRNIAQSASDWFWETNKDGRFSFISDRANDILGVPSLNVIGKTRLEIVSKSDLDSDPEKWRRHLDDLENHRPFKDFVYIMPTDDNTDHFIRINGIPFFNDDGEFQGYQGTGTDITGQMRVEDALRESEERHRNFAADVAHELRTPLAVIRTHLDNLSDSQEAQSLRQDVDNMSRMVTQLLAITRIETYTPEEIRDEVELREICRNVATMMAPLAIKEHRSIELTGGDGPVMIKGNSGTLEQAVRNLVENAIRYSARGTVITLNVTDTGRPTLKVIDRGRGIDLEKRDKIFQRFKRSDRRGGGSGLGLSIVKRAVESHNGEITIEDTPEGGATFVIQFPVPGGGAKPEEPGGFAEVD